MNVEMMRLIANRCTFPGYEFRVVEIGEPDIKVSISYLQVRCASKCNVTGDPMTWNGRKWLLSSHMVKGEIVQTCFLAVMTAMEHEVREQFKYDGAAIFGPHFNVERLVTLCQSEGATEERL